MAFVSSTGIAVPQLGAGEAASSPPGRAASTRSLLAEIPVSASERQFASLMMLTSMAAFVVAIPFAKIPLLQVPAFIPAYEAALIITDLITAVMLLGQFVQGRSRALLVLAAGYLFDALIIVPHAMTFPGLFAPTGLLGAGPQSTAWIYMLWHGGFPLFVMLYAGLRTAERRFASPPAPLAALLESPWMLSGIVVAIAAGATLLTTAGQGLLPSIMEANGYTAVMKFVVTAAWGASAVALAVLWRHRHRSVLDIWLVVVMCAWICDIGLSAVFNAGRFDLGFYSGRLFGLLASSFVLVVLTLEMSGLHGRLARSNVELEHRARRLEEDVRQSETEQRQIEAQLRQAQKMEAIGNLTGGMAHDFNNLLGIVIGNLDILRERRKEDAAVAELGGEALDAALRGADLTRRLLAFARRQPLQPKVIALNELVEGITRLLSRTLGEAVEISLDLGSDLWPVVADPAQLEASITNLATNARDAMPEGGRLIIATRNCHLDSGYAVLHPEVTPGDFSMVEVSDTGAGMAADTLAKIFEPFFTTKEPGRGTGLGLSMVYGYMKQSGGHVAVYSEVGLGTTFRLFFPRASDVKGAAPPSETPVAARGRGEAILVVEDNDALRRVAVRQLEELGYTVLEAEDAAAALNTLANEKVDVLFSDVVMPGGMTGFDLAEAARRQWPDLRVVLTSGFPDARQVARVAPSRARVLSKPYRREELAAAIALALEPSDTS